MNRLFVSSSGIYDILKISLIGIFYLSFSCAGLNTIERYKPIMGYWRTDRNFILSVHRSPQNGVAAIIKTAPGFLGDDAKPGKAVITNIKPLADGGFTGLFKMPGEQKAVKVKLVFSSHDTLLIISWDRRVMGNIMKWQRVKHLK